MRLTRPFLPSAALVCCGLLSAVLPDALAFNPDPSMHLATVLTCMWQGESEAWPEATLLVQQDLGARPD